MSIVRMDAVKAETGHRSHASIYQQIKDGLFTKPVPIGTRAVGWPIDEVKAITDARIAGCDDQQLRDLVTKLHEQRAKRSSYLVQV